MQIVIEIDDDRYEKIINNEVYAPLDICVALYNGTPLPEHHGRIIDETQIHKCGWNYIKHHAKTDAPTIIEEDKESDGG